MLHDIAVWVENLLTIPGIPLWVSIVGCAVSMALISIVISIVAVIYIPAEYFVGENPPDWTHHRHPILRWTLRILRNVFGWVLVLVGIILSLPGVPGQGLLTILLGLMLTEFPGKRRLEKRLVRLPHVHKAVDRIRARFGTKPLILEDDPPAKS